MIIGLLSVVCVMRATEETKPKSEPKLKRSVRFSNDPESLLYPEPHTPGAALIAALHQIVLDQGGIVQMPGATPSVQSASSVSGSVFFPQNE